MTWMAVVCQNSIWSLTFFVPCALGASSRMTGALSASIALSPYDGSFTARIASWSDCVPWIELVFDGWYFLKQVHRLSTTVLSILTPDFAIAATLSAANFTSSSVLPSSYSPNAFANAGADRGSCMFARPFIKSLRVLSSSPPPTYVFVSGSMMMSATFLTFGSARLSVPDALLSASS